MCQVVCQIVNDYVRAYCGTKNQFAKTCRQSVGKGLLEVSAIRIVSMTTSLLFSMMGVLSRMVSNHSIGLGMNSCCKGPFSV